LDALGVLFPISMLREVQMPDVETQADAFLEAIDLLVLEADARGLAPVAVARLLFGFGVLLMQRRDGPRETARFMRQQLNRLEKIESDV
jgi:hypothetical protein